MKSVFLLSLVFSILTADAQSIPDTGRRATITKAGEPSGIEVKQEIGPKGGSLSTSDNILKITIPPGALAAETTISVTPIRNYLSGDSLSGAYRLEPHSIKFLKPVQLEFRFDPEKNNSQKGIATQDKNGQWIDLSNVKTDTLGNTITGEVSHFSDWALFNHYDLVPLNATLYTEQSQLLEIRHLTPEGERVKGGLVQFGVPLITEKVVINKWSVNGIEGGNSSTGMIAEGGKRWGIYLAPSTLPSPNPVTVTAYFRGTYFDISGNRFKDYSLSSTILVKERGYRFTYIHKNLAGCFHTIDSSTCLVRFDNNAAILSDIINHKPWSDWDPCTRCNHKYTNKETFKANVEIWGMTGSKITPPADPGSMTDVHITLAPAMGNTPAAEQQCPKSPKVIMPSFALPAEPKYIHFEARGDDIIVHYMGMSGRQMIRKKVKNEEVIIKVERL